MGAEEGKKDAAAAAADDALDTCHQSSKSVPLSYQETHLRCVKSVVKHPALSHVDSTQVPFLATETISCQISKAQAHTFYASGIQQKIEHNLTACHC